MGIAFKMAFVAGLCVAASLTYVTVGDAAQLVSANTSLCVDVPHSITVDGTPPTLFPCHGTNNEQWTIANGTIRGIGGTCLDVMGSTPVDGAQIIIVACNGRPSQKWQLLNGQIVGLGGKCLDIAGGNATEHAGLALATCTSTPSQQWSVQ
jgi:hypothetical protein